ncbi:MAG TPA: hypothetical protein VF698_12915 [Thermoanaerobaculia bacterium]
MAVLAFDAGASRRDLLRAIRIAPGPAAITSEFVARQRSEGLNAVLLYDLTGFDGDWQRPDEAAIARQLAIVREHGMAAIVSLPALVPQPDGTNRSIPDDLLRERLRVWSRNERGEIAGFFFVHDDMAYLQTPASEQRRWLAIAREIAPTIPVLGIVGEFALRRTDRFYWDAQAFDHLLWIVYPYNLSSVWNRALDHTATDDPDGELTRYLADYTAAMKAALFDTLAPGQLIVPIIQTFTYEGEPPGSKPRPRDITLQVRTINRELRTTLRQRDNFAMTYFYAVKSRANVPYPEPLGIYDVDGWTDAVIGENQWLELMRRAWETVREARPGGRLPADARAVLR